MNRGHVFAGEVGSMYRATYTIIGDTVNLAARLMSAAPTGALYVAPEVVERSRTLFATEALEPFSVKGKSQPVRAVSVGPAIGMRTQRRAHELQFIGRDAELAAVTDAIEAAVAAPARCSRSGRRWRRQVEVARRGAAAVGYSR